MAIYIRRHAEVQGERTGGGRVVRLGGRGEGDGEDGNGIRQQRETRKVVKAKKVHGLP